MNASHRTGTVILVHGAWADGSCWSNIILPLRSHGLNVIAAQIPLTSLSDDFATLRQVIERTDGPLTVVGHAYGGAVLAGALHERVKSLAYIAALAPDAGETVADVFYRGAPHPEAPSLAPDQHGLIWMPEEGFRHAVAHKASPDQTAIMAAVQRPISVKCIEEKTSRPAWRARKSWFLVAEEDRMIPAESQRFMAERMGATICSCPVDHTPMYTAPHLAVDVVLQAARAANRN